MYNLKLFNFIFICLLSLSTAKAQSPDPPLIEEKSNVVYGAIGTAVLWHSAAAFYEKSLARNMWDRNISSFAKVGVGYYELWDWSFNYGGPFVLAQYGLLTGAKSHHLEIGAGLVYIPLGDLDGIMFSPTFGYRIQSPEKPIVFRTGLSYPEGLYLSLGFSLQ